MTSQEKPNAIFARLRRGIANQAKPIILKQIVFTYFSQILTYFINLAMIGLLSRGLGMALFGTFLLLKGAAEFLSYVGGLGLQIFMAREVPGRPVEDQTRVLSYCIRSGLRFFLILCALITLFSAPITNSLKISAYRETFLWFIYGYAFWMVYNEISRFHNFRKSIRLSNSISLVERITTLTLMVAVYFLSQKTLNVNGVCLASIISFAFVAFVALQTLPDKRVFGRHNRLNDEHIVQTIRKNAPFLLINLFTLVYMQIDRYLLAHFHDTRAAGEFGYAMSWIYLVSNYSLTLYNVNFPYFAEHLQKKDFRKALESLVISAGWAILLTTLGCVILLLLAPFLVKWISGESFLVTLPLIRLLIFIPALTLLSTICQNVLTFLHQERKVAAILCFSVFVNLGFDLWWIPKWKTVGAAWANNLALAMTVAVLMLTLILVIKRHKSELALAS